MYLRFSSRRRKRKEKDSYRARRNNSTKVGFSKSFVFYPIMIALEIYSFTRIAVYNNSKMEVLSRGPSIDISMKLFLAKI